MIDFVGDNDHGDTVPPTTEEILMRVTRQRDKLYAEVCRLENRVAELLSERDEARRSVCDIMEGGGWNTKEEIATERGWDCFRNYKKSQEALDKLSELDEELGLQ